MSSSIESVLQEKRVFPPSAAFIKQANISGMDAYKALVAEAEKDMEGWLCPALFKYFEQTPQKLYVQVKAAG